MAIGFVGMFVPLLPTVVFWIIAAWCFGKANPLLETWLLEHPTVGPHILAWRERRAISRKGKLAAAAGLAASSLVGLVVLPAPWFLLPPTICAAAALFIWTRPE